MHELERRPGRVILGGHSMGAVVAVLAGTRAPERVAGLVLVGPSALPIVKPVWRMTYDFGRQVVAGRFGPGDLLRPLADLARSPRAARRLARSLCRLDLSSELAAVRDAGIPATVIACSTDTLTTPESCRRIAELLGGTYRELHAAGGHVWMFGSWHLLARELERAGDHARRTIEA